MPEESTLLAHKRDSRGKQVAKRLRNEGMVPGILYGPSEEPSMLSINRKDLVAFLHTHGRNVVVDLSLDKKDAVKSFIYDIQHDPISGDITHIDFKHIKLTDKLHMSIPVHVVGTPEGVKNEGGVLEHVLHTVEIECLPTDIPDPIEIDVSEMHIGDSVHVSDLPKAKAFDFITDMESAVVIVAAPKMAAALEEEEAAEEAAAGEEMAEPELIGEEKEEGDGEGESEE